LGTIRVSAKPGGRPDFAAKTRHRALAVYGIVKTRLGERVACRGMILREKKPPSSKSAIDLPIRRADNIARGQEFVASAVDFFLAHDETNELVIDFLFMR
jgi:hypothetical protein